MSWLRAADNKTEDDSSAQDGLSVDLRVRQIICEVLGIDKKIVAQFENDSGLFGHLPELDSMAVAGLLTEIEDQLGIFIEDDDIDGEMLETYGGLLSFVESKLKAG